MAAPKFNPNPPAPLRKPGLPKRSLFLSIFLFITGIVFLLIGFSVFWNTSLYESIPFSVLGWLCFIPGAYHVFLFVKIAQGADGYTYELLEHYQ